MSASHSAGRTGPPRGITIGLVALAAVAAVVIAVILLQSGPDAVGEADPSPTPEPASVTPQPSEPTESAEPTAEPTPSGPPAVPETWTEAATFSEPGRRFVVGDLVAWSDGLVAVGTRYEDEGRSVFGPPPPHTGQVWRSTDGTDWTDATPADIFADVELRHLFETADGALVVIGHRYPDFEAVSVAWETRDGETWTPADLTGFPLGSFVTAIASGRQGHLADAYHSTDGRSWQQTLEGVDSLAAGDEGFVVSTTSEAGGTTNTQWLASGDGLAWIVADKPADGAVLPAARGGDWLATTTTFGDSDVSVATWGSANGLDWSSLGEMPLQSIERFETTCEEVPGILHGLPTMTVAGTVLGAGMCGEGAVVAAGGSYASVDGADWVRLPFGDYAYAAGAAMIGDRVVIATDTRTSRAPVIGVTFWVSEP